LRSFEGIPLKIIRRVSNRFDCKQNRQSEQVKEESEKRKKEGVTERVEVIDVHDGRSCLVLDCMKRKSNPDPGNFFTQLFNHWSDSRCAHDDLVSLYGCERRKIRSDQTSTMEIED